MTLNLVYSKQDSGISSPLLHLDRRPQEEQDSDPFKVGESHWLDN